jgi:di/tripeptidase
VDRPSAIHALVRLGERLLGLPLQTKPRTSLNIGSIRGGTTVNTIARRAALELDLRSESEAELARVCDQVEQCIDQHGQEGVEVSLKPIGERPGGGIPSDHPLVRAAREALRRAGENQCYLESGSTDASVPLSMGLPAVCVGITRGGEAHSLSEFIEIPPIERGYQSVRTLIRLAAALP